MIADLKEQRNNFQHRLESINRYAECLLMRISPRTVLEANEKEIKIDALPMLGKATKHLQIEINKRKKENDLLTQKLTNLTIEFSTMAVNLARKNNEMAAIKRQVCDLQNRIGRLTSQVDNMSASTEDDLRFIRQDSPDRKDIHEGFVHLEQQINELRDAMKDH